MPASSQTGRERVEETLQGRPAAPPAILPILHSGLARMFGVPLGRFYSDAALMADVLVRGQRQFGYDGVQATSGVTAEAEALGARVDQPDDALPVLREHVLADLSRLPSLRERDPVGGGRMPLFFEALRNIVRRIGDEAFVLATLRGPFLTASQLRGPEAILVDLLESPDAVTQMLEFTTETAARLSRATLAAGAHGLIFGEATCSPSFISPALYRNLILPHHRRLIAEVHAMGWRFVGLHVCGNTASILEDLISTGADFLDVDYQVAAERAIAMAAGRVTLRGNLDPSAVFWSGNPEKVGRETAMLCKAASGARWILSSGCDISPGTPEENVAAFVETARAAPPPDTD